MSIKETIKKFIPDFLLSFYHYLLALIGVFLYGFPSKKIKVIGITGTSGKTTIVSLIAEILEEAGYKVACLSSIKFKIAEKEWENELKMTMPGRFKIQKFLRRAVKENCQYLVLEVTSEGIKQFRHKFIDFEAVVFANLSPEHIEAHASFENYRKAKLELFKEAKNIHIINLDDKNTEYFLELPAEKKWLYKIKNQKSKIKITNQKSKIIEAENIIIDSDYIRFEIQGISFALNLLGKFNIYNALAAICIGLSQGISLDICQKALEKVKGIPGRMEVVVKEPFKIIVDYAHTPEALEKAYKALKSDSLICVLGSCGGGRDKWKRPVLGEIAEKYCKEIIVTNEDPYDEDPMEIIEQVAQGAGVRAQKILDRREAIKKAIKLARPKDVIIITGKGSEPWICSKNNKKIPWDDRQIVKQEINDI